MKGNASYSLNYNKTLIILVISLTWMFLILMAFGRPAWSFEDKI